jgi:hypothetical protein
VIREASPDTRIVVDSSKRVDAVEAILETGVPVDVVLLIRDVRSWAIASHDVATRRDDRGWFDALRRPDPVHLSHLWKRAAWFRFTRWHRQVTSFEQRLTELGVLRATIGYEPLATDPEAAMRRITAALDLDYSPDMLVPANGFGHTTRGNIAARTADAQRAVVLSTTWLTRDDWLLPALVRRKVMATNRRLVYGIGE